MNKVLKWTLRVLAALLALVVLAVCGFFAWDRIRCWDFYAEAERGLDIPGLWDGFVPQGFTYDEQQGVYLTCGYDKGGDASRIYILDGESEKRVDLKNADGSDYTGHTGGIALFGDYVYITGDAELDIFLRAEVFGGSGTATQADLVALPIDPAYCTVYNGVLYTGSYYHPGAYETPAEQRITTPAGDGNKAVMLAYALDAASGKPHGSPIAAYSTRGQIQGMTFVGDNLPVLASSYGLAVSGLHYYDMSALQPHGTFADAPLYHLDSACRIETVDAPPMAEEIVYRDGKVWIMNEAASMKYLFGKLTFAGKVHGIEPPASVKKLL